MDETGQGIVSERDPRLSAFRPDLADARLKGRVTADRFASPSPAQCVTAVADLRRAPRPDSPVDTQVLYGEMVDVFEAEEGWCWVQAHEDKYVGYVADTALTSRIVPPTHIITAPRTFLYPGPDMKLPAEAALSMGARIAISGEAETRGTSYLTLARGGAVIAAHAAPVSQHFSDPVAIAERLLETPYLWGGRSGHGIDCSGLVQMAYAQVGISLQRDTGMQRHTAGRALADGADLQRGDLVFWQGHVAMMADPQTIIHASGHAMAVVREGFDEAVARIGLMYGAPNGYRRIDQQGA
jgi:cell wall-associated NlpC family hydrolase